MEQQDLWNEIVHTGGDCQMDSKETEVVISILEHEFGRELAKVEDLEPEQMTTLSAVANLILARL
jgi:acyl carrier protein